MAERWGTPKEYASYYRLLLTESGRKEFHWWLEQANPDVYLRFLKEAKLNDRPLQSPSPRIQGTAQAIEPPPHELEAQVPPLGADLLAGGST